MMRAVSVFAGLLSLAAIAGPQRAVAGDYYDEGYRYDSYRPRYYDDYRPYYRSSYRPYSSDCCYRRVTRYERIYRDYDRPYYGHSYRGSSYYDRPYRPYYRSSYYDRPYSYDGGWTYGRSYYGPTYVSSYTSYYDYPRYSDYPRYYDYPRYSSYDYSSYRTASYGGDWPRYTHRWDDGPRRYYAPGCRPNSIKIYDDAGGWVWSKTPACW